MRWSLLLLLLLWLLLWPLRVLLVARRHALRGRGAVLDGRRR